MKRIFVLLAILLGSIPAFATTAVGTKVIDTTGNLLPSGQWCFGSSCFTVTNGAFSGTVTAGTQAITVKRGSNTYLTVPGITIAGSYFSWDTFVVPSSASISGMGAPYIACAPGAQYSQTDGAQNKWQCQSINGVGTWNGLPSPGTPWTVSVGTTTTLPPGSMATVQNSGSGNAPILNFGIPTGAAGPNCATTSPAGECDLSGTIRADQIAANSIAASKLTITDTTNICANGSGASGTDGWSGSISTGLNPGSPVNGPCLFTNDRDAYYGSDFAVNPGETYYFSVLAAPWSSPQGPFSVGLHLKSSLQPGYSHAWSSISASVPAYPGGWTTISGQVTIPSGYAYAQIWVQISATAGSTGSFAFQNLIVRKASSGELLVDGSITASQAGTFTNLSALNGLSDGNGNAPSLPADPTWGLQAATKQYADTKMSGGPFTAMRVIGDSISTTCCDNAGGRTDLWDGQLAAKIGVPIQYGFAGDQACDAFPHQIASIYLPSLVRDYGDTTLYAYQLSTNDVLKSNNFDNFNLCHKAALAYLGTPRSLMYTGQSFIGLASITSGSGGTVSGTGTCKLTEFNNGDSGLAAATVTFTTSGSWTGATFAINNVGSGFTAAPTTALLSSGTATCSGTAMLTATISTAPAQWALDSDLTYPFTASKSITGLYSTTQGASASWPVTTSFNGQVVYLWYRITDGNGGKFTYTVDGGSAVMVNNYQPYPIATQNGTTSAIGLIRITGLTAGSHTIVTKVVSATSASNVVDILAVGVPPQRRGLLPIYVGGTPPMQYGQEPAGTQALVAQYNAQVKANVALLAADGINVQFVDVESYLHGTPSEMWDAVHPNSLGHHELMQAYYEAINPAPNLPAQGQNAFVGGNPSTYQLLATDQVVMLPSGSTFVLPSTSFPGKRYTLCNISSSGTIALSAHFDTAPNTIGPKTCSSIVSRGGIYWENENNNVVTPNTQQVAIASTLALTASTNIINTDGGATPITTLSTSLPVGTIFYLTSWSSPTSYITLKNTGNIELPNGISTLNLPGRCTAEVVYENLGNTFLVTGVTCAGLQTSQYALSGSATLSSGAATVTNSYVTSASQVQVWNCGPSGTAIGVPSVKSATANTNFVINSISATNTVVTGDTSTVCWRVNLY